MNYYTIDEVKEHIKTAYWIDTHDWDRDDQGGFYYNMDPIYSSYMMDYHKEIMIDMGTFHYNMVLESIDDKTILSLEADCSEIKDYWRPGIERLMNKTFICNKQDSKDELFKILQGYSTPLYFMKFDEHLDMIHPKIVRALDKSVDKDFLMDIL